MQIYEDIMENVGIMNLAIGIWVDITNESRKGKRYNYEPGDWYMGRHNRRNK